MLPVSMGELVRWVREEHAARGMVFGLPEEVFFRAAEAPELATSVPGALLDTPLGVAAGPHTQLAPNLVTAYLGGARFLELKTVQTLDRLEVSKPCIDMEDVGYNCEWSQELRLPASQDEYLKAWILLHGLERLLPAGLSAHRPGLAFNMSVGYNLDGIQKPNVQAFLVGMRDARVRLEALLGEAVRADRRLTDLELPSRLTEAVTLSTMHGCPPEEIERIGRYLISAGLHTTIKLNPTLLGPGLLREILHGELGFHDVEVPDQAFEHDPRYPDAVDMLRALGDAANKAGVAFGVKLTNTLETRNVRKVLPAHEAMHYLSGRALHPLSAALAHKLSEEFRGALPMSLAGGADAFNLPALLAGGLGTVTVCSDVLRPGGYGRLSQYLERLRAALQGIGAESLSAFARATALADSARRAWAVEALRSELGRPVSESDLAAPPPELAEAVQRVLQRANLAAHAAEVRRDPRYRRPRRYRPTKTARLLGAFDCAGAPCQEGCPAHQNIPDYLYLTARGEFEQALEVVLRSNPLPAITGHVCDHPCATKCVRNHYDAPLAIREVKRFLTERVPAGRLPAPAARLGARLAVVGAGPAGLSAAYHAALAGLEVCVFEAGAAPGGVPARTIPAYRLPEAALAQDIARIAGLGVEFRFGVEIGREVSLGELRHDFDFVFVGAGAGQGTSLRIPGEQIPGVHEALSLLAQSRAECAPRLGRRVLVVGGGNSAMDAARTARRLTGPEGQVRVVYRRALGHMPADDEELEALRAEGVELLELTAPVRIEAGPDGRVRGLVCLRMRLGEADASGRPAPEPLPGSEHELPADAIVVAVGQRPSLGFLAEAGALMTRAGAVRVDDSTGETSLSGVFAGGDAVTGGADIIQAEAEGRFAVAEMLRRRGRALPSEVQLAKPGSPREHLARKSRRVYPEDLPREEHLACPDFTPRIPGWSEAEARREAGRCFACDAFCGLCVTVCPNRANLFFAVEPVEVRLPALRVRAGKLERIGERAYRVRQPYQIANLADLCNECGNCRTFCPTAGAPYRDKPRVCASEESFALEARGVRLTPARDGFLMRHRRDGALHVLEKRGRELRYESPALLAVLGADDLAVRQLAPGPQAMEGARLDLGVAFELWVLSRGLTADARFLPGLG
jgi:putative selenate reductase